MISRLPRWIELGGFLLAGIAGFVNAVGLLGFQHEACSHVSGTATSLAISVHSGTMSNALQLLGVMLSFMVGAMASGIIIGNESLKLGRRYGVALTCEAALLLLAMLTLEHTMTAGYFLTSAACGLQNAMATTYSGAVIRTTHLTGIVTDLGLTLGHALRGEAFEKRKVQLFLVLISGFVVGGMSGAALYDSFGFRALIAPAAGCLILAGSYRAFKVLSKVTNQQAEEQDAEGRPTERDSAPK